MTRSGEEIQKALEGFVKKWASFDGTEKAASQTFLNQLVKCYSGVEDVFEVGATFEEFGPTDEGSGYMDLYWPEVAIIEMKRPSEGSRLEVHRYQVIDYWRNSADIAAGRAAPRFLVLCSFNRFEVWEPGKFPKDPIDSFALTELPDRYEALLFLAREEPLFVGPRRELTIAAANQMVELYRRLEERHAHEPAVLHTFVLQTVWCLFAEGLKLLPNQPVQRIVDPSRKDRGIAARDLVHLFDVLNEAPGPGRDPTLLDQPYVNGQLFNPPAHVYLNPDELELLGEATTHDWRQVDPTIFGSLLEGFLGRERRWETGIHYTHEADIMKIVRPSIIEPWTDRIGAIDTPADGETALDDLCRFRVLDPACGCGNFLYVAYRELRAIEDAVRHRMTHLYEVGGATRPKSPYPPYALANLHGIEIDEFAVGITRIVLWMGQKLAADRYDTHETVLPLVSLSNVVQGDALKIDWPEVDAIIGNPPFIGTKFVRSRLGDEYAEFLRKQFGIGVKDYCVYWFRKSHDRLDPGKRAGLVGTKSVAESQNRRAALEYIADNGGVITNAVSSQKWPGEANVHVSIVNWVKEPAEPVTEFTLDGADVAGIDTGLNPGLAAAEPQTLEQNAGRQFAGVVPGVPAFVLDPAEAAALLAMNDADYGSVVQPYLTGDDILSSIDQAPTRWIINFGEMSLEEAMRFPAALKLVRERVKPIRDNHKKKREREQWWKLSRSVRAMFDAIGPLSRFIAGPAQGKRILLAWCEHDWCPSNLTNAFAFDDDCSFGILSSRIHMTWASVATRSRLKGDPRYTSDCFNTFPWPDPMTNEHRGEIGRAARQIVALRHALCTDEQIGLTELYNRLDDGAYEPLRSEHRLLDEAVAGAYGWPKNVAKDANEFVRRLLELNQEIASGARTYSPFAPPATGTEEPTLL